MHGIKREYRWKSGAVPAAVSPRERFIALFAIGSLLPRRRGERDEPEDLLDGMRFGDHGIIGTRSKRMKARPTIPCDSF